MASWTRADADRLAVGIGQILARVVADELDREPAGTRLVVMISMDEGQAYGA